MKLFNFFFDRLKKWWAGESSPHHPRGFLRVIWHSLSLPITFTALPKAGTSGQGASLQRIWRSMALWLVLGLLGNFLTAPVALANEEVVLPSYTLGSYTINLVTPEAQMAVRGPNGPAICVTELVPFLDINDWTNNLQKYSPCHVYEPPKGSSVIPHASLFKPRTALPAWPAGRKSHESRFVFLLYDDTLFQFHYSSALTPGHPLLYPIPNGIKYCDASKPLTPTKGCTTTTNLSLAKLDTAAKKAADKRAKEAADKRNKEAADKRNKEAADKKAKQDAEAKCATAMNKAKEDAEAKLTAALNAQKDAEAKLAEALKAQKIVVKDIQLGFDHSCLLTTTGDVKCWGSNKSGQLGDGTTTNQNKPVTTVSGLKGVRAIAVGYLYSCALTTTGNVKCWGENNVGQLGDGTIDKKDEPVKVSGLNGVRDLSDIRAIVPGYFHSCALTTTGGVNCWGWNNFQPSTTLQYDHPVAISDLSGVRALGAGNSHSCALTMTGDVKCWGSNSSGQLGDDTDTSRYKASKKVSDLSGVRAIAVKFNHSCALTTTGVVKCWGANESGQLGDGTTTAKGKNKPVKVDLSGVSAIAVGNQHSCALTKTGGVKCWGANEFGQLGDSTTKQQNKPVEVFGLSGVSVIAVGAQHSCALMTTGGVKCWGYNHEGQLGDGSSKNERYKPVDVQLDSN